MIFDVCCGSKMFWFQKHHDNVIYMDIRSECFDIHGKHVEVTPDIVGDFRKIPFDDDSLQWWCLILHIYGGLVRTR